MLELVVAPVESAMAKAGQVRDGLAQSLAGDCPGMQADAADHLIAVNDGDAMAELGRGDSAFLAGGAAADDD